jgi:ubiquitin-protein ligase
MIDLQNLKKERPDGIDATPDPGSILKWHATIQGPEGSRWEGRAWKVDLQFTESYPMEAPKATFLEPVQHPNVSPSGVVCVDVLEVAWTPVSSVVSILVSLQMLLACPNPHVVVNLAAVRLLRADPRYRHLFR